LAGLRLAERGLCVHTSQSGKNFKVFVLFHCHFTRPSIWGQKGVNRVSEWKHTWHLSIPAKPCTRSRLLLAKIGGSLEGVRERGFKDLGLRVYGLRFTVYRLALGVKILRFRVKGFKV